MKLVEIIRYELWYQARRPTTWLFLGALAALAFQYALVTISFAVGGVTPVNAPYSLAMMMDPAAIVALLPIAVIAGEAAGRDVMTRLTPLLYTAPVTKSTYLGGHLVAALLLAAGVSLAWPAGALLAVALSDAPPSVLGAMRPEFYAYAWLVMTLPNTIVATSLAFAMATFARRPMGGWVAGALLFIASTACLALLAYGLGHWTLASLLDPLGLTTLREMSESWTPDAMRYGIPWMTPSFLWNRALWIGVAAVVIALMHHRFRLAHYVPAPGRGWRTNQPVTTAAGLNAVAALPETVQTTPVPRAARRLTFGVRTSMRQLAAIAGESWRIVVLGWGGLVMLLLAVFIATLYSRLITMNGLPLAPSTALLADAVADPTGLPAMIALLLILFYAGELVWRDREAGLGEISGAAPVPDWAHLLGRVSGLALAMATFQAAIMTAAIVTQLRLGFRPLEPWLHARLILGIQLADYLLLVPLAIIVHVVIAHKYVGHLTMLLVYGYIAFATKLGLVEHRLLVFAADPGWSYSDMRGFGGSAGPWLTLQLYWGAWTALLLVAASLFWVRGREASLASRLRMARRRLTRGAVSAASAAGALVLLLGGFTFYNTNVLHEYLTSSDVAERSAEYERRYGRYARTLQPRLEGVRLHAELHPERGSAEIRGSYLLRNRGDIAIDSIHVTMHPAVDTDSLTLNRAATPAIADHALGYRVFDLQTPLQPGDTVRLGWVLRVGKRGFANGGGSQFVTPKATFIRNFELPSVGYQNWRELKSPSARLEHGLPDKPAVPSLDDAAARLDMRSGAERAKIEAIVGTSAEQRAVAPGTLKRTWLENGRRYFEYVTEQPIRNDFAIFSARYATRTARWSRPATDSTNAGHAVDIEVLHHPAHAANVDRMIAGMRASLEHLTAALGPYPHGQLRFVEQPGLGGLHASPINIWFPEGAAQFDPGRDDRGFDFPFAIVAHEVAHQWWGNQLTPAPVEGRAVLSEGLAWYSAMGVVEHMRGREELERLLAFMREAWLTPKPPSDPPLLRANDFFLAYRKGPLALYALREYVGAEQVDIALRQLLSANAEAQPPLPTMRDLYRELQAITPDSVRPLLHDLFAANTFWELATEELSAVPVADGMVELTLAVRARKIVVDVNGAVTEVPMHDLVEIGAFADDSIGEKGAPMYRQLHRLQSGAQRITLTVPARATWAGVDPRSLLFDLDPWNNVKRLSVEK